MSVGSEQRKLAAIMFTDMVVTARCHNATANLRYQLAITLPLTMSQPLMRAWEIRIKFSPGSIALTANVQAC
jgi:hypothetical protein